MIYGEPTDFTVWRYQLKIPGVMVTDAKSLYDHLNTTGSIPKERPTLIDLLVARDLVENHVIYLKWMPTSHMVADMMTKDMKPSNPVRRLLDNDISPWPP